MVSSPEEIPKAVFHSRAASILPQVGIVPGLQPLGWKVKDRVPSLDISQPGSGNPRYEVWWWLELFWKELCCVRDLYVLLIHVCCRSFT